MEVTRNLYLKQVRAVWSLHSKNFKDGNLGRKLAAGLTIFDGLWQGGVEAHGESLGILFLF